MSTVARALRAGGPWVGALVVALAFRYFYRVARTEPFIFGDEFAGVVGTMVGCLIAHLVITKRRADKAAALGLPAPSYPPMTLRVGLLIATFFIVSLAGVWWFRRESQWVTFFFMLFLLIPLYAGIVWARRVEAKNGPPPRQVA